MQAALAFGFGSYHGREKVRPIGHGDVIRTHSGASHIVLDVSDNVHGAVFICVNMTTGADSIVLEREVSYRRLTGGR